VATGGVATGGAAPTAGSTAVGAGGAEPCPDADGDGICDADDACPEVPNQDDEADADSDGIPNACDPCGIGAAVALDPLAIYRLGESSGETASSSVASGADAEYVGVNLGEDGVADDGDTAVELEGSEDSYVIADPVDEFPTTALTIAFWVNNADPERDAVVFSYASSVEDNQLVITLDADGPQLQVTIDGEDWDTEVELPSESWQHVAISWDSAGGEAALYLNGVLEASTSGLVEDVEIPEEGAMVLGQDQDSVGGDFSSDQSLEGLLDELVLFDRALVEADVATIAATTGCGLAE
jgi:hypothetical protein